MNKPINDAVPSVTGNILSQPKVRCEIYTRVVGFYRPVSQFNKGKQEEYKDRKEYKILDLQ